MIEINKVLFSPDLSQTIRNLDVEIRECRDTPDYKIELEKLREVFRSNHVYHSAGIEGNRLTMAETAIVLNEGIDISGKPLRDSIEVRNLGLAFDFLYELSKQDVPISEDSIKQIHKLIIGDEPSLGPGEYRNIGLTIRGSEHKPPEPFEVPIKMEELVKWINENENHNPIIVAAIAHHEFVKIHPFKDGNGPTARILLNLILLKKGFPVCNIRRGQTPMYYKALSLADEGAYEPIVEVVAENCYVLFKIIQIRLTTR
jgi:Fic family protein